MPPVFADSRLLEIGRLHYTPWLHGFGIFDILQAHPSICPSAETSAWCNYVHIFKLRKIRNGRMIMIFVTDALRTAKTGRQIFSKCRADLSHNRNAVRAPVSLRAGLNTTIGLPVGGMMRVATDGTNSSCEWNVSTKRQKKSFYTWYFYTSGTPSQIWFFGSYQREAN